MNLIEFIKNLIVISIPCIEALIKSKVVPYLKRRMYQRVDYRVNKLISDLAQNASKINNEENEIKRAAYIEGTKLGIETIRAIADKLEQAADEIEKVI